jgi:ubiquinol-cytochrome c reductase cytochrome b subunit
MLLVILGFALSGYLLPWDQKAYWATTVTINIARSTPIVGEHVANVLRGGAELGALTLGRWFTAHVLLLPMALTTLVVAHIALMRRHGISGPLSEAPGPGPLFFPWHVVKDTVMMATVFASLVTLALVSPAPLDEIANPADASYIPRPEWYFLSLFQLLKYFPGPLEPVATMVIPGLVAGFFLLVPFVDRGPNRHPGQRRMFVAAFASVVAGVVALTALGLADRPDGRDREDWGLIALGGEGFAQNVDCLRCHTAGGSASPLSSIRLTRDDEWMVAPGARADGDEPKALLSRFQAQAVVAFLRRRHAGQTPPAVGNDVLEAAQIFAEVCAACHSVAGDGGSVGPDLTRVGRRRSEESIRRLIEDPLSAYPDSEMPPFNDTLTVGQIGALARYLASRK